jgi:hypothetical protein
LGAAVAEIEKLRKLSVSLRAGKPAKKMLSLACYGYGVF